MCILTVVVFYLVEPPRIGPFAFSSEVVNQGSFAQITCSVIEGDSPVSISWSLKGDVISSEPSLTTTMVGTRTSILLIESVGYRHSGIYTCRAANKAGTDFHSAELKVNGIMGGKGLMYAGQGGTRLALYYCFKF